MNFPGIFIVTAAALLVTCVETVFLKVQTCKSMCLKMSYIANIDVFNTKQNVHCEATVNLSDILRKTVNFFEGLIWVIWHVWLLNLSWTVQSEVCLPQPIRSGAGGHTPCSLCTSCFISWFAHWVGYLFHGQNKNTFFLPEGTWLLYLTIDVGAEKRSPQAPWYCTQFIIHIFLLFWCELNENDKLIYMQHCQTVLYYDIAFQILWHRGDLLTENICCS